MAVNAVGLSENILSNELTIFPNPTEGDVSISLGAQYSRILVSLTDLSGRLIEYEEFDNKEQLNFRLEIPNGIYLLNIDADGKKSVIKLIRQN